MRTLRTALVTALLLALLAVSTFAQTPEVPAGAAVTFRFLHNGVDTDGYRLFVDGAKFGPDIPRSALTADGVVDVKHPGFARGTHTAQASAFNADGENKSAVLTFTAKGQPPAAPGTPTVFVTITVARDGTITVAVTGQ